MPASSPIRAPAVPSPPDPRRRPGDACEPAALVAHVMEAGARPAGRMMARLSRPHRASLDRTLRAEDLISDADLSRLRAERAGITFVDPLAAVADPRLALRYGIGACLRDRVLPWAATPAATLVLADDPDRLASLRPGLEECFGPVQFAMAAGGSITAALLRDHGARLLDEAETRVPAAESCRSLDARRLAPKLFGGAALVLSGLAAAPVLVLALLTGLAVLALAANTLLKAAALGAAALHRAPPTPAAALPADLLPCISVLVALYGEAEIAPRLIRRLERLDYPRDRLDLILVVEEDDAATRAALARADLPAWMRVAVAPRGQVRTKPRALNIALAQCRGTIVGVYDAEDAPEADQLQRVAARFAVAPPDVACLQGVLDFYNGQANPMARVFALEYAGWFRLVLPGFQRLRLVLPLGGTTLFFRRSVLERLGAWDAHNVTEDADLGLRLARHGWRTEMLDSVTLEEANCLPLPWVRQRSRWIKGYLMTWAVHMRSPVALWRGLGSRRFVAVQVQFLLTVAQSLLAPALWSFWLVGSGGSLALLPPLPPAAGTALLGLLVMSFALDLTIALVAHRRAGLRFWRLWVLALPVYHALATAAAYKALWDMALRPFHWDKTKHGRFGG